MAATRITHLIAKSVRPACLSFLNAFPRYSPPKDNALLAESRRFHSEICERLKPAPTSAPSATAVTRVLSFERVVV